MVTNVIYSTPFAWKRRTLLAVHIDTPASSLALHVVSVLLHLLETTFQNLLSVARQAQAYAAIVKIAREVVVPSHVDNDIQIAVIKHST